MRFRRLARFGAVFLLIVGWSAPSLLAAVTDSQLNAQKVLFGAAADPSSFPLIKDGVATTLYVDSHDFPAVQTAVKAFGEDLERVGGTVPRTLSAGSEPLPAELIIVGMIGKSAVIDDLRRRGRLDTTAVEGKWESAITAVVEDPLPGVRRALVVAGSDRRGTAFALFTVSRLIGISPWYWWADVPVTPRKWVSIMPGRYVQGEPSVKYRGIFLNDEDWGLRPWAAKKMDPELGNIGPATYSKVCELLLRLHANLLWPAMHPGSPAFHLVSGNAETGDRWGIVMGSSHSEVVLRNNVGEWDHDTDGPWNYQTNSKRMKEYWADGLRKNSQYENEYSVGLRGLHDSGLEAVGSPEVKARLVEKALQDQRALISASLGRKAAEVPEVLWLYKESIDLYRTGMRIPDDVTLGWTDDNYGYIRQLPNSDEQKRSGGSALYYHVSYWGKPHDYLWLCTTPPALMREELTKAFDHGVRRLWVLNVGDLKPAETDMDYFLSLAWDEPGTAAFSQHDFLSRWASEQFGVEHAPAVTNLWERAYQLNFVRKPEFMGFNGYDDLPKLAAFNPLAWGGQDKQRLQAWVDLAARSSAMRDEIPFQSRSAFFELVAYPIEVSAAQNQKFLYLEQQAVNQLQGDVSAGKEAFSKSVEAYDRIQALTAQYNQLENGKWQGMMSAHPRDRHVFDPPAALSEGAVLPKTWGKGETDASDSALLKGAPASNPTFKERNKTVSMNAAHFTSETHTAKEHWHVLSELGVSGGSITFGEPDGSASLTYSFATSSDDSALLQVGLLPTFPLDSSSKLRYAVRVDDGPAVEVDGAGAERHLPGHTPWEWNVLSNISIQTISLGRLKPGPHRLTFVPRDPGLVLEHVTVLFPGSAPAYPVPPETPSQVEALPGPG